MKVLTHALTAVGLAAGSALVLPAPALAQSAQPAQPERKYSLSKAEQAALNPLLNASYAVDAARKAGQTPDWSAVRSLLPAARAAAKGNDARFLVARIELSLALATNDLASQERLLGALIANPSSPAEEKTLYRNAVADIHNKRAEQAFQAKDYATAERIYRELLQANPGDTRLQNNLRISQERSGNTAGAVESTLQQIRAAEAGGGSASEALYRGVFESYYRAQQRPQAMAALATLLRHYPTQANWQTGVAMARERAGSDTQLTLDALRFARAAGALRPADYLPYATELNYAGLPGETMAVIEAGTSAGAVTSGQVAQLRALAQRRMGEDRAGLASQMAQARAAARGRSARLVADALFGYGRYGEAADLYRVALTKGGEDANLVNTRLGASLALAGRRAEAEAALKAVTGSRADLAQLWLAWLGRRIG